MAAYQLPTREACVVHNLINDHAVNRPDAIFACFEDGTQWTYRELHGLVVQYASGLQQLGVKQGDFVLSWLPNGPHAVRLFLALNYLGAVYVPINTSYRGGVLQHVISNSGAALMIADARLVERLDSVDRGALQTVVVIGDAVAGITGHSVADNDNGL